ncbi:divalent-cation tolerance protein CutA [Nitrogeniibacter mangrovi]|uniref:Divalent-cation tolerance protein CutA n=1 Tax=Nitrogeniibacter mangrovi TaxID=2016596 RepID=A0A6C1AZG5_9RHOO|nr:divalent-cation tolerance protein CutA [Nitrogeniibacter mangrovi]QID16523.1 divalent-cation tolerance protein CutA [Nitrogeniibacter mangrovi]
MTDTPDEVLLVLTNLPDADTAQALANALIEARVAACVNILAPATSVYRWQGKVSTDTEVPLLIKTTRAAYPMLASAIRAGHPYELPEIIAVPVTGGLPDYLDWVRDETRAAR